MKPEIPLKSGDETDVFTKWRHWLRWKPGEIKRVKRLYWKKVRKFWKKKIEERGDE